MNILIAEDQFVIQLMLEVAMRDWGFSCDIVSNGYEAVRYAKAKPGQYDLCIMDVSMPVMDGIEAARLIREEVGCFPILGYSSDVAMRDRCLDAGMDGFLLKPCSREALLGMIEGLVGKEG
jgi:CheY-like chemotaxis protein